METPETSDNEDDGEGWQTIEPASDDEDMPEPVFAHKIMFEGSVYARRGGSIVLKRLARVVEPGILLFLNDMEIEVAPPIVVFGARLEFSCSMKPSKKSELPDYLSAFMIDQWKLQPPSRSACVHWVAFLGDLVQGGNGSDFIPKKKMQQQEALSEESFLEKFALRVIRDPDFKKAKNVQDLEERVSKKTTSDAKRALVFNIALTALAYARPSFILPAMQFSQKNKTTHRPNNVSTTANLASSPSPLLGLVPKIIHDTDENNDTLTAEKQSKDTSAISWLYYLKTQVRCQSVARVPSESGDLCAALLDGVAILKLIESFGVPFPRDAKINTNPGTRVAALENWELAIRALRRSAKLDHSAHLDFLGPPEGNIFASLEIGHVATSRKFLRALFDAYKSTRLRIEATPMLLWFDQQLRIYGIGLTNQIGDKYSTDLNDSFRPAIASAFADGRRLLILLYHVLVARYNNPDTRIDEMPSRISEAIGFLALNPKGSLDLSDAAVRLDDILTIALAADVPRIFIDGKTFLNAFLCKDFDFPRDDSIHFLLLQLHFIWRTLRSVEGKPGGSLDTIIRLYMTKEEDSQQPQALSQQLKQVLPPSPPPLIIGKQQFERQSASESIATPPSNKTTRELTQQEQPSVLSPLSAKQEDSTSPNTKSIESKNHFTSHSHDRTTSSVSKLPPWLTSPTQKPTKVPKKLTLAITTTPSTITNDAFS